jgi:capsular polysaccharide biosynthesis protein
MKETKVIEVIQYSEEPIQNLANRPNHIIATSNSLITPSVEMTVNYDVSGRFGNRGFVLQPEKDAEEPQEISKCLNLFTRGGGVYARWLLDLIPKTKIVQQGGYSLNDFDIVIVNKKDGSQYLETFEKLNISYDKTRTVSDLEQQPYRIKELVSVSEVRDRKSTPAWVIKYLNSIFQPSYAPGNFKRIYLSRAKTSRRKVLNEGDVISMLKQRGFAVVNCEDYSIEQQSYIMREAEIIISPHSGALGNIVFCRPGTKLFELYSQHLTEDYWLLCKRKQMTYWSLSCMDSQGRYLEDIGELDYENHRLKINEEDLIVDTDKLAKLID